MFKSALDDFMLKILMVCAVVSITVDMSTVEHTEEYYHAWIDGFAIMVAVLVVSGVVSVVDYKKEVAFVDKRNVTESEKKVSLTRNGVTNHDAHPNELLVGDLIELKVGD